MPKEFKETEVRVYNKSKKHSDEDIAKYVFKVITVVYIILVAFQF